MNKNAYRIIFSQTRGMFIAVAEIVKSRCKSMGQSLSITSAIEQQEVMKPTHYKKINPLNFAVMSLLGAVIYTLPLSQVANAQIVADQGAPKSQQPTILNSGNGTPQVNIQTPSAGGVSRNTYSQFDVDAKGAILNNSRNNTQTQIGGWVQGNPWLAKGEAKVILNEVNSANPSQLKGYLEVAGKQAQVIIANPSGLVCDGCGVINADRFTLTTGEAVMNQGYLESFRVREGQVTIAGKGLNGSLTPFTDIYSRALQVNAGLYANTLNTVLGQNDIAVKDLDAGKIHAVETNPNTQLNKTNFALDVGQLGGMYAGKIYLVGTEKGLGVRNAGSINATQQQLILNANGDLVNAGNIIANKDQVQITARDITNQGNISSATSQVTLQSQNLENTGLISSVDELRLQNQNTLKNSGKLNAARIVLDTASLQNSGSIEQTGLQALDLKSGQMSNVGGKIGIAKKVEDTGTGEPGSTGGEETGAVVPKDPSKDGGSLEVVVPKDTKPKSYDAGYIHVKNSFNNDQGAIVANGGIDLSSENGLDNNGGELALGQLSVKGNRFENNSGKLYVKQGDITVNHFENKHGLLQSQSTLNVNSQALDNQDGKINTASTLQLNIAGHINNQKGQMSSATETLIQAHDLKNDQGDIEAGDRLDVGLTGQLDNLKGKLISANSMNLQQQGLNNTEGQIYAKQIELNNHNQTLNNSAGKIVADTQLVVKTGALSNLKSGILHSQGQLAMTSNAIENAGVIQAQDQLSIHNAGHLSQVNGIISSKNNLKIISQSMTSDKGSTIAAGLNDKGEIDKNNAAHLEIKVEKTLQHHGQLLASQKLTVDAADLDLNQGLVIADQAVLTAVSGDINNTAGRIQAKDLQLNAEALGRGLNNKYGVIDAQHLTLKIDDKIDNQSGVIQQISDQDLALHVKGRIDNQHGTIQSNAKNITIKSQELLNDDGLIQHAGLGQLSIKNEKISANKAKILTQGDLNLSSGTAVLNEAVVSARHGDIQADTLSTTASQLIFNATDGQSSILVKQALDNQQGVIQSSHALNIQAAALNNQKGVIQTVLPKAGNAVESAHVDLNIDIAEQIQNDSGVLSSAAKLDIQSKALLNNKGVIVSAEDLVLAQQGVLDNQKGTIQAKNIKLSAESIANQKGQIIAKGALALQASQTIHNGEINDPKAEAAGLIRADQSIDIQAKDLINSGLIYAGRDNHLKLQQKLHNEGQIAAAQNNDLRVGALEQTATGSLAAGLKTDGSLATDGDLTIAVSQDGIVNGQLIAATDLNATAASLQLDNSLINAQNITLTTMTGQLSAKQTKAHAKENLSFNAAKDLGTDSATISAERLMVNAENWSSQKSLLQQRGQATTEIALKGVWNNTEGQFDSKAALSNIRATALNNQQGVLQFSGENSALHLVLSDHLNNQQGKIISLGELNTQSAALNNQKGEILSFSGLNIAAKDLNNQNGKVIEASTKPVVNRIEILAKINNQNGIIQTNSDNKIKSKDLENAAGVIQTLNGSSLDLELSEQLDNQKGRIYAQDLLLKAGAVNNDAGQMTALGTATIEIDAALTNREGLIAAQKQLSIETGRLDNRQGQISSVEKNIALQTKQGALLNQGGKIQAVEDINLNVKGLDNSQHGLISTVHAEKGKIQINSHDAAVTNNKGQINSAADVVIQAGDISNQHGLIAAQGVINLKSDHLIDNSMTAQAETSSSDEKTAMGIQSLAGISLTAEQIKNNAGNIVSSKDVSLTQEKLDNSAGGRITGANIVIQSQHAAGELNNQSGQIGAQNNLKIDLGTANSLVNNSDQGLIAASGEVEIRSAQIINAHTKNKDESGIQASNIRLDATVLDNSSGQIKAENRLDAYVSQQLNNTDGLISSLKQLNIIDQQVERNLQIQNQHGLIIAGQQDQAGATLQISSKGMTSDGRVLSLGDLDLNLVDDYIHGKDGQLQAKDNLKISSAGKIINNGEMKSNGKLVLHANQIENSKDAEIESQTTELDAQDSIINAGLINGAKTYLTAQTIDNNAGRIYGDHIAIAADTLNNNALDGTAPVIASRGDIDLGVNVLNNNANAINQKDGSQIIALGDIRVGGTLDANHHASGQAKTLNNLSSVISANGNIVLNVDQVNNKNLYFTTKKQTEQETLYYWNMDIANPRSGRYNPGQQYVLTAEQYNQNPELFRNLKGYGDIYFRHDGATMEQFLSKPEGYFFMVSDHDDSSRGNMMKGYVIYDGQLYSTDIYQSYETTRTTITDVVDQSAPAMITAGKDLSFNGKIFNDKSQIVVGGTLQGDAKAIINADAKGEKLIQEKGIMTPYTGSYGGKGHDKVWDGQKQDFNPADITQKVDVYLYEDPIQKVVQRDDQTEQRTDTSLLTQAQAVSTVTANQVEYDAASQQTVKIESEQKTGAQIDQITANVQAGQLDSISQSETQSKQTFTGADVTAVKDRPSSSQQVESKTASIQADGFEIRSVDQNVRLPNSALYKVQPDSKAGYLIETDPKFSNHNQWLSSDYMLKALGADPTLKQKRLGDGYYEQRLIQDQVAQLTGRRFINGYSDNDAQYKALMNNGLTFAKQFNLRPGIALTPAQIAQLSSDIVWLVEKTVTLADGRVETVLVPQVYVRARVGDLSGDGTLISADKIDVKLSDDLNNAGTIAGRDIVKISSQNLNNLAGHIQGGVVDLATAQDLNNIGGVIKADQAMQLQVQGDLNILSTTQSNQREVGKSDYSWTGIDRVAGLYVGNQAGIKPTDTTMLINVGGNTEIKAANLQNTGVGKTIIQSGGDIKLSTVHVETTNNVVQDASLYHKDSIGQDLGTQIQTVGDLSLNANNIALKAAQLASEQGSTVISAKNNIDITEGRRNIEQQNQSEFVKKGSLSSSKTSNFSHNNADLALGSNIEGKKVIIDGNNVNIRGSQVVSDDLTQIQAKENINITAADNHSLYESTSKVEKSGLMSSGGIGFSIGSEKEKTDRAQTQTTSSAAAVGSLKGDTNIIAGKNYQQTGSYVSATEGNVNILAQSVNIEAAKNTDDSQYRHEYEKKGLTIAVNVPVVSAVQGAVNSAKQVGQSKSGRVNAMAAANTGFDAYKAGQSLAQLKDAASSMGSLAENANVSVSITYGEQKNIDESQSQSNSASQSKVYASGKTTIVATGAGEQSNINIIGSDVLGVKGTTLAADHDINIKAAEQNSSEQSKNTSQGWNAGVAVSYGKDGLAFGVTAGGNVGKGKGNGEETSHVNSHVGSKDSQTTITSANATHIVGGQVQGKGIDITTKELNVESLQDTATYKSKQQNVEGQVTVGYGFSASGSFNQSNINANHASVNEQSGIFAGDDGYQVKVEKNTDLKGAIITSTQQAEDLGKNRLETGTLTSSDIHNISEYDAKGIGISGSVSVKGDKPNTKEGSGTKTEQAKTGSKKGMAGFNPESTGANKSVGFGLDSAKDQSTTQSGINTQNIVIKDEQAQQALTGKTAEQTKQDILTQVTTDNAREHSGALANNFDKDKVQKEINTQVEVTKKFGENAPKVVADFAEQQYIKLLSEGNEVEANKWKEGGIYRVAMHTAIGALSTGSVEGALGTAGVATAAPILNQFEKNISQALKDKGMSAETAALIANGVSSLTVISVGSAIGLTDSTTGIIINVDANNRQLHPDEARLIEQLAEKYAKERGISEEEAKQLLTRGALYNIDEGWSKNYDANISKDEILKYNDAYQYLRDKVQNTSVNGLYDELYKSNVPDLLTLKNSDSSIQQLETIELKANEYRGNLTAQEAKKADYYTNTVGTGFSSSHEDFKNKDIFLTYGLAGSAIPGSYQYNDNKKFIKDYAAIKDSEIGFTHGIGLNLKENIGNTVGFVTGVKDGVVDTAKFLWNVGEGAIEAAQHPTESAAKAKEIAKDIFQNMPEIAENMVNQTNLTIEKREATLDLYDMQQDKYSKGQYQAKIYGEFVGGGGVGSVGKKTAKEVSKTVEQAEEIIKKQLDNMTPHPATVAGTPDANGGAIAMTGKPDTTSSLGKTEVVTGAVAVGSGEKSTTEIKTSQEIASIDSNKNIFSPESTKPELSTCSGNVCFTAGTLIETDQGLKAIEKFFGGELIWSRNENTLEYGYRPVIATKISLDQAIFQVVIQNANGQVDILETTSEHPFWIKDHGWLKASLLQSGMTLLDRNNQELTILSQALIPNKLETVYNIEVEGFHTYHVGKLGTWVHNANCCDIKGQQVSGGNPTIKTDPYHPDNVQARQLTAEQKQAWMNSLPKVIAKQRIAVNGKPVTRDIDLEPTLKRIIDNKPNSALKDGKEYLNTTSPKIPGGGKPPYTEWVVPTEGVNGRGSQRIVVDSAGSMWYSPNHYGDFRPNESKPISPSNLPYGQTWRRLK